MSEFKLTVYINNMSYSKLNFKEVIDCDWDTRMDFLIIVQRNGTRTQIKESVIDMIIEEGK